MSEHQDQMKGRLYVYGALESRDELDERLEKCYREMCTFVGHSREVEVYNMLNDKVNQSKDNHEDINLALLYSILTEPSTASKQYHTLTLVNRDSFSLVISYTEKMMMEKMTKLQETTRIQFLWLTREVVQTKVAGADKLCFALLKQLPAGSTSSGDIYIAENLMHILLDNRDWLDSQTGLISSVVYTYLSLIPCHGFPALATLRDQESNLCVSLIRTRFTECCAIGRDLVRLLQAVTRIPEFTELWKDLLTSPQNISPQCTSLSQLLSRRTSRRFIGGRVLVEVEMKLTFLLSKVKFGQHRRYQEWFQKKYLSSPESHHLIPELIRFICCVIHPTNEVLGSDVIPRWALIGWLISLCQSNPLAFANAKLALFYDWLTYNPEVDSIMNIEPGILLMHHSLRAHPQVTASLLDFLCRMVSNFCQSHPQLAESGIKAALRDILNKGVLLSLDPIFESPRLDEELRALVKATFSEFFQPLPTASDDASSMEVLEIAAGGGQEGGVVARGGDQGDDPLIVGEDYLHGNDSEVMSAFSDPEDIGEDMDDGSEIIELEGGSTLPSERLVSGTNQSDDEFVVLSSVDDLGGGESKGVGSRGVSPDPWTRIGELPPTLGDKMLELKAERDETTRTDLMSKVLELMEETCNKLETESTPPIPTLVASPLAHLMVAEFSCTCLEDENKRDMNLSHVLFQRLSASSPAVPTLSLAQSLREHHSRLGYFFLYYLHKKHTPRLSEEKDYYAPYRKLAVKDEEEGLKVALLGDIKVCVETDIGVLCRLLPSLCKQFSVELVGEEELLNLLVSHIDPSQLGATMYQLLNKEFQLFGRQPTNIHKILMSSLEWESFEQFSVWQLLNAEGPDPSLVIPSLADMNMKDHSEAISSAMLFLKNESSGYSSIAALLSLPTDHAPLVDVIGGRWVSGRPTKCAKILSLFLEALEKKHADKYPVPETNLILGHLQRILQVLNNKQILEASELALSKTLSKHFKTYPQLGTAFGDLCQLVSSLAPSSTEGTAPPKKDMTAGHKRSQPSASSQDKPSKHEPKNKRRRLTNREGDSDNRPIVL